MKQLLSVLTMFTLAACGGSKDDGDKKATTAPAASSAPAVTIASTDDYDAKNKAMLYKLSEAFGWEDCDKTASLLTGWSEELVATSAAVGAWEKAHPEDKAAYEKKNRATIFSMTRNMGKVSESCKDKPAFAAAIAKLK